MLQLPRTSLSLRRSRLVVLSLSLQHDTIYRGSSAYLPTARMAVSRLQRLRWGQDGLALRSYAARGKSTSQILLIRGPSYYHRTTANLLRYCRSSKTTIAVNSGNTTLTLSGSNFMPGGSTALNGAESHDLHHPFTKRGIAASDVAPGPKLVIVQKPRSPNRRGDDHGELKGGRIELAQAA